MNLNDLINNYWNLFLAHVCEFHPLDEEFISAFEEDLDWRSISKNRVFGWNLVFLKKYESRFIWHELARNQSITWTPEWIDLFKDRLSWFDLSRNINLPVSVEFIERYTKVIRIDEGNKWLTDEIRDRYRSKLIDAIIYESQIMTSSQVSDLEETLKSFGFSHNQRILYQEFIRPQLEIVSLENVFRRKFDYSQRYYELAPVQTDINGLTPEYRVEGSNPFGVFREGRNIFDISGPLDLTFGPLQEGPDRLYEIPRFSSMTFYPVLLVSEGVKEFLQSLKLPEHRFHPINLRPRKLKTTTRFYIFQLNHDTLTKDLTFSMTWCYTLGGSTKSPERYQIEKKINSYLEFETKQKDLQEEAGILKRVTLLPDQFRLKSDYDIYSYSTYHKIIVNEHVKKRFESLFPGQASFTSVQLLNIRMPQDKYDAKARETEPPISSGGLNYVESPEDRFYYDKKDRLDKIEVSVPEEFLSKDEFRSVEERFKVLLPYNFKNMYWDNYSDDEEPEEEFYFLPLQYFYIQNGFSDKLPETYRALIVAENGCGDALGLILERNSDFRLQDQLFEFNHENGEIEKYTM